jgi:hypothetical protein
MRRRLTALVTTMTLLVAAVGCRHCGRGLSDLSRAELEQRCRSLITERAVLLGRNHALECDKVRLLRCFSGTLSAVSRCAEKGDLDRQREVVSEAERKVKSELAAIAEEER